MRGRWKETPLYVAIFLDLFGFGAIIADFQLHAQSLVPRNWPIGVTVGALLAITFVLQTLVSPAWGSLSDRVGRKPVFVACGLLSGGAMLMYGFSASVFGLLLSRVLSGFGGANVAVAQAAIADAVKGNDRTVAMGRVGVAISSGLIAGAPAGGLLAHYAGSLGLGLVAGGCSLFGTSLVAVLYHPAPIEPSTAPKKRHVFDIHLLRDLPELRPLVVIAVVAWLSLATLEGTFARLIHAMLGMDQRHFGLIFGYESALGLLVQGFLLAAMLKWAREEVLLRGAYALQGLGLALNPLAGAIQVWVPGMATLLFASTLYAVGSSLANPVVNGLCSRLTPESRQGELFGLMQGARSIGFVVGPMVGGALFDVYPPAPYLFAGLVCLLAAALVPRVQGS